MFNWIKTKIRWFLIAIGIIGIATAGTLTLQDKPIDIPTSKLIDGQVVSINYTDENAGEDLIIKTDQEHYASYVGNFNVFYSITNISDKGQTIKTAFSFKDNPKKYVREIQEFVSNEIVEVDVPVYKEVATATGTEMVLDKYVKEPREKTVWGKQTIKEVGNIKTFTRKDTKDTKLDKGNEFYLAKGETKFFKANIKYSDFKYSEEFFIEAFGSEGGYGNLDPFTWEELFNDDTKSTGDLNGQDGWSGDVLFDVTATAASPNDSYPDPTANQHIKMVAGATAVTIASPSNDSDAGIFYISIKRSTKGTIGMAMYAYDAGNTRLWLLCTDWGSANDIQIYTGTAGYTTIVTAYSVDTWYRIGFDFDTATQVLKWNVDGGSWTAIAAGFESGTDNFDHVTLYHEQDGVIAYYDSISPDYEPTAPVTADASWEFYEVH